MSKDTTALTATAASISQFPTASGAGLERRALLIHQMLLSCLVAMLGAAGLYGVIYWQTGAWQFLVEVIVLGVGCLGVGGIFWLLRQKRWTLVGYSMLGVIFVVFGSGELVWQGATIYLTAGVILLSVIVAALIRPALWRSWLVGIGLYLAAYGAWALWVNLSPPLPRYDISQSPLLSVVIPLVVLGLAIVLFWQLFRAYQRLETIQVRLTVSLVLLMLLVVMAISSALLMVGTANGRRQAVEQLESVARIKEAEIGRWVEAVQTDLSFTLSDVTVLARVRELLEAQDPLPVDRFWVRQQLQWMEQQSPRLEELWLVNARGEVIAASDMAREGVRETQRTYFKLGQQGFYLEPVVYLPVLGRIEIMAAQPVWGAEGELIGVLAARVAPATLAALLGNQGWVGQTGEIYLVDQYGLVLTDLRFQTAGAGQIMRTAAVQTVLGTRTNGSGLYTTYGGRPVVGVYHWLSGLQVALVAEQSQAEALSLTNSLLSIVGLIALGALIAAILASVFIVRDIAGPLAALTETATRVAGGDLTLQAPAERQDEIGVLAQAFNAMTAQLRSLITTLEQRVADRTRNLQAAAEVGRATTEVLDPAQLLQQVVELVQERFDLYYVGLFLLDSQQQFAVLQAGTGEAGRQMLARHHRLAVGGDSMIGQCVARNEARIALDVGAEAVRFDNPLLPLTRSELALPLRARGRVIGAMTVQSTREGAFDESDIVVMQTMADQVAVAIENARLFAESQVSLQQLTALQQRYLSEAWREYTAARTINGYRLAESGLTPLADDWLPAATRALQARQRLTEPEPDGAVTITVPVILRGIPIGVLGFRGTGEWSAEDVQLVEMLAEQLALAADNLRLLDETQRRAAQERAVSTVSARLRAVTDIDAILRTVAQELGQLLGASALVHLLPEPASPATEARPAGEPRA